MAGTATISKLRREAQGCRACPLWREATQAVFGEGPRRASIVLVGEQPGDSEDRAGHPFVGPAGGVLDRALAAAEIRRAEVYTTNAVKHFKYRRRGKRRIHQRPSAAETTACRPWLEAELELVSPRVVVALGATATYALFRETRAIGENRGRPLESALFSPVIVTAHPSSVLRERDAQGRELALQALGEDLRLAAHVAADD